MSKDKEKLIAGVVIPWKIKEKEAGKIMGDKKIIKKQGEEIEELAHRFIWAIVTDF